MPRLPRTLQGMWTDINKRFFDGGLPPVEAVELRYVPNGAEGSAIDARHECAATTKDETTGRWVIEVNEGLRDFLGPTYLTLAHEAIHVKLGIAVKHGKPAWAKEVRRLTGKGLLRRVI